MSGPLDHAYQYRMLRKEVFEQVKETRRIETYALGALAVFYALVLTRVGGRPSGLVLALAPAMVLLAAARCWVLLARIGDIAAYMREIEIATFGRIEDSEAGAEMGGSIFDAKFQISDLYKAQIPGYKGGLPGWEQHFERHGSTYVARSAIAYWAVLFVATLLAAIIVPALH